MAAVSQGVLVPETQPAAPEYSVWATLLSDLPKKIKSRITNKIGFGAFLFDSRLSNLESIFPTLRQPNSGGLWKLKGK
ncbi:MAG TPA: hypothetical protein PKY12_03160, partial [Catalimonadaceae bacterium]|nr:hypothetical protein [Catalimonadaceae bacterium]